MVQLRRLPPRLRLLLLLRRMRFECCDLLLMKSLWIVVMMIVVAGVCHSFYGSIHKLDVEPVLLPVILSGLSFLRRCFCTV